MGSLIDQFGEAVVAWAEESGEAVAEVTAYVLIWVGGIWALPRRSSDFTVEEMTDFLEFLNDELRMDEVFLIGSLIHAFTGHLEQQSAGYDEGIEQNRARAEELRAILSDPERLADYLERLQRAQDRLVAKGRIDEAQPVSADYIRRLTDLFERFAERRYSEPINRGIALELWTTHMAPILARDNLESAKHEQDQRWGL